MKTFNSLNSFWEIGINVLTGEADATGLRLLCDLSEAGRELMCRYLALPLDTQFQKNWNSLVGAEPAVASMLIARDAFKDILTFALFTIHEVDVVIEFPGGTIVGGNDTDEYIQRYLSDSSVIHKNVRRNLLKHSRNRVGDRCVHAMSGRTS